MITPLAQRVNVKKHKECKSSTPAIETKFNKNTAGINNPATKERTWKQGSNAPTHSYRLRNRTTPISYKKRAAEYILAQHIFCKANHM